MLEEMRQAGAVTLTRREASRTGSRPAGTAFALPGAPDPSAAVAMRPDSPATGRQLTVIVAYEGFTLPGPR